MKRTLEENLKIRQRRDESTGCLLFTGYLNKDGYGELYTSTGRVLAHRAAAFFAGIITSLNDPSRVCHHCDNPPCTEPDHLYSGNAKTNIKDAIERGRWVAPNTLKTKCKRGHLLEGENLVLIGKYKKRRQCRICRNNNNREWMRNKYHEANNC